MFSHSFLLGSSRSDLQFIDDLINLCKRHQIGCGEPRDLDHLATDLLFNEDFRIDLFTLCTAISHMTEVEPTPQQLLILVARAFGGPALSIRDVNADIPHSARSAFLNGYEAWLRPQPQTAPTSSWTKDQTNKEQPADRTHPPSRPTLYFAAASLSQADSPQAQQEPPTIQPTTDAAPHISIPPNTPIESLTLNELRIYLEDIESRVSRIEPKHERLAPHPYFPPEYFERLEALDNHKSPKAKPHTIIPVPAPAPESAPQPIVSVTPPVPSPTTPPIIPIIETDSTLPAIPYAPVIVPYQAAITVLSPAPREVHHAPSDIAQLRQLRSVNVFLIVFLAITCCLTAFFAYRYLDGHPPSFADTISQFPHSFDEQSSAATAPNHASPLPPATLFIPNPVYNTGTPRTTHSARMPGRNTAAPPVSLLPQPRPSISNVYPKQAPVQNPVQNPEQNPVQRSPHPATFASIAPSPYSPADTSTPPPSTNAVVSVPSAMMMSYAIAAPKPVYPSSRHIGTDSTVDIETTISKDGRVIGARALDGTLDVRAAAVEAVLGWRFRPFLVDGKPVGVVTTFKFVFKGD